jgi:excisionase family DNA binding protein
MNTTESVEKVLMRPNEVAQAVSMSRSKVYELIASGQLPSVRVAGCVRVPVSAFKAWLDGQLKNQGR